MSAGQILPGKRWNADAVCLQLVQCLLEATEVLRLGQHGNVRVSAQLRCAVQHARLSDDQQVADLV